MNHFIFLSLSTPKKNVFNDMHIWEISFSFTHTIIKHGRKKRYVIFFYSCLVSFTYYPLTFFLFWRLQIKYGRKEKICSFFSLLVLLCLILTLYSNILFVVAASNQTGEEGLIITTDVTKAVTAVAKVMVAMFKVVDAAPEVLIMAARLRWGCNSRGCVRCRRLRLRRRPR